MSNDRPPVNPWDLGDYSQLSRRLEPAAVAVAARAGNGGGRLALDVAAGDGAVASALAREAWHVHATDGSDRMVELGRARTGDMVAWRRADLAHQPFDDGSMDLVTSSFGLIFGADPAECVSEVARILNPAGRLVFTAWVDDGYMAEMTGRLIAFFPDPPAADPLRWGSKAFIASTVEPHFLGVEIERRWLPWSFTSAAAGRHFLQSASPAHVAAGAALGDRAEEMMDSVEAHLAEHARADGSVEIEAEYWLVDAHRIP